MRHHPTQMIVMSNVYIDINASSCQTNDSNVKRIH